MERDTIMTMLQYSFDTEDLLMNSKIVDPERLSGILYGLGLLTEELTRLLKGGD